MKAIGALYPLTMLYIIVATGNHFLFDAAAGGLVVLAAWLLARAVAVPSQGSGRFRAWPSSSRSSAAHPSPIPIV